MNALKSLHFYTLIAFIYKNNNLFAFFLFRYYIIALRINYKGKL